MTGPNQRQAVILSGGAAYGGYEVSVMKALFQGDSPATNYVPLEAQIFSGTSAGSYNAAVMVSQPGTDSRKTVNYLENIWANRVADDPQKCGNAAIRFRGDLRNFMNPECLAVNPLKPFVQLAQDTAFLAGDGFRRALNFAVTRASLGRRLMGLVDLNAFISLEPYNQLVRDTIDLAGVRRSDKLLTIAATNWATGLLKLFQNADLTDQAGHQVVLGSSAFPGVPPVWIDGQ